MDAFLGMISAFGFSFTPTNWMACNGQLISISSNSALFALLGTQFGGNGQTTFGLPDLRGRTLIGQGQGPGLGMYSVGQMAGAENATLSVGNLPAHSHPMMGSNDALAQPGAAGGSLGSNARGGVNLYAAGAANQVALASPTGNTGNNQPFGIMQPFTVINYCICVAGIFPSRN